MVLPILALLPAIFSAISSATELFDSGKHAVEAVTGRASEASSPEELEDEIKGLSEAQQTRWARAMQHELDLYRAETDRIEIEGGRIGPEIAAKLGTRAAERIAILRQTTRPWAVRMAMHFILLPVYLALVDVAQGLAATWIVRPIGAVLGSKAISGFAGFPAFESVFGVSPTAILAGDGQLARSVIGFVYTGSVGWLTGIVVAYMGLREIGKARGTSGDVPLTATPPSGLGAALAQAGGVADQVAHIVARVRDAARAL